MFGGIFVILLLTSCFSIVKANDPPCYGDPECCSVNCGGNYLGLNYTTCSDCVQGEFPHNPNCITMIDDIC